MKWLETGMLTVLMVSGAACGASTQRPSTVASGASCSSVANLEQQVAQVYDVARVRDAKPIYETRFLARAIQPRQVVGAELYVDAEPSMNQPYMERVLSCYAEHAGALAHPNDPLTAENIRDLDVRVQGHQYVIEVLGADHAAGREIWQRAAALKSGGRVDVRQLSAAESVTAF